MVGSPVCVLPVAGCLRHRQESYGRNSESTPRNFNQLTAGFSFKNALGCVIESSDERDMSNAGQMVLLEILRKK